MNRELELQIKDFQIIKNAKLKFVPGLNVIQGESNNGKTAIFRAIKSAIYNVPGTTNVRYGADCYVIGIAYGGNTVIYKKGTDTVYIVNGQQYNRPGRAQLTEVADALGVKILEINGTNEQLNFWDQMDKPFLLDRTPTELFRFIVDSGKDDNIVKCMADMVSDRQGINKSINASEGSIAQLNQQIAEVSAALTDADKVLDACESVIKLGPQVAKKEELTNTAASIANAKSNIETIKATSKVDGETIYKIKNIKDKIQVSESKSEVLRNIDKKIKGLTNDKNQLKEYASSLHYVPIPDTSRLSSLENLSKRLKMIKCNIDELKSTTLKKVDINIIDLVDDKNRLDSLVFKKNKLDEQKGLVEGSRLKLEQTKSLMTLFSICPLCGQPRHNHN